MRYLKLAILLTTFLCCAVSWADNIDSSVQPNQLSLQDCITAALSNNADILIAKNNVKSAQNRAVQAKSDYYPKLSLQTNAFTWGSDNVLNQSKTGTALSVDQSIYDGGLRELNAQSARYGVIQSKAGQSRTLQTTIFNVSKAYYEALRAKHLADVAEANVKYNEGLRDQIQARADLGDAAKVDVLPVEAQLANARVNLISSRNDVRTSLIQLQSVMGMSSQPGFDIKEIYIPAESAIDTLDVYVNAALMARPDIRQYQANTKAAKVSVKSAGLSLYPRPVITAQYQHDISGGSGISATQVVGGISFDLFDGGANRAAYKEAQASRDSAEVQEKQIEKDIRLQVEEAYINLVNSKERMTASKVSLESADRNYQAQKERYDQGLGTTLDLLNAEVQVISAQNDDILARYDYYIAITQMDYAAGR